MYRKSMKRQTAGLVLAILLVMSAPAAAAGALGRHDSGGLWAGVWAWVEAVWNKQGSTATTTAGGEQGSHIDPDGRPCATCSGAAGTTTTDGERGAGIDPDGKPCATCSGAAGTTPTDGERGGGIDPDGAP